MSDLLLWEIFIWGNVLLDLRVYRSEGNLGVYTNFVVGHRDSLAMSSR